MALKHDAQGFLVGDPIDLSALVAEWAGIREDVRAIRQAVLGIEQAMSRIAPESTPVAVAVPGRSTGLEEADPAVKALSEVAQPVISIQPVESASAPVQHQQPESARPAPSVASAPAASRDVRQIPVLLRTPATPQANAARGGREGAADAAVNRVVAELRATRAATLRAPVEPPRRDGRGRFVKGQEANQSKPGQRPDGSSPREEEEQNESLVRSLTDRVTGAVREASTGLEEADPAVKALSEVAQPMARGFELITGGGDQQKKQERWLRRIFNTLTGSRKEQGLFNKIAAKRLKAIEEKPVPDGDSMGMSFIGGLLGLLGGLFAKIPGIGKLLPGVAGAAGAAGAAAGMGKAAKGGGIGRMLRRVPILGALIGGAGLAYDLYSSENDETLTRRDKDRLAGRGTGSLAGAVGGMWAGAKLGAAVGALGGPIGAAIGGLVGGAAGLFFGDKAGQVVGETVGGWVSDLREADIGGMIAQKWDAAVERFSSKWDEVSGWFSSKWDEVSERFTSKWDEVSERFSSKWDELTKGLQSKWDGLVGDLKGLWGDITSAAEDAFDWVKSKGDQANDYIKSVTGVDVKETARTAVNSTREVAATAIASVRSAGNAANEVVKDWTGVDVKASAGRAVTAAKDGAAWVGDRATAAKDWVLGKTSKLFESGSGGAGTVSTGRGDHGGASYGTYQLASNTGTLKKFLDSTSYGEQFKGMTPGTREFNDKWKQIARDDPNFGDAQHEFIKQTHFDPQIERLNKAGIDLSGRGAAVKDSVWSTSVQFGGNSSLIEKALAGRDVEKMSDSEIVSTIQDYKIQNNDRLFASSSDAVRRGTLNRAHQEKERLLELAQADIQARPDERSTLAASTGEALLAAATPAEHPVQAGGGVEASPRNEGGGREGGERALAVAQGEGTTGPVSAGSSAPASSPSTTAPTASPEVVAVAPPAAPAAPVVASATMPEAISLAAPAAPVVAVASVPAVPSAPTMPPIADAPPVSVPMASGDTRKPVAVVSAPTEVGQDLRERGIAHIATGGLGKG
ncbi:hypothetical protein [Alcaligenes phenolicus]|uniref:VgrG-related protein n=1 Tax=Alcaligenes phenolicus TaxID=232846 RepID=UPI002AA8A5E7|nr:hypothetical protein [Alcaligenes phenolicus]